MSQKTMMEGRGKVFGVFLVSGLALSLFTSCSSKGLAPVSPKDPYACNAPKTKEEKAYYEDVYSGDWQKRRDTGPLGYFGLSKFSATTTPPPHWTMEVPEGAKPISEVYQENYEKQMAQQKASVPAASSEYQEYSRVASAAKDSAPSSVYSSRSQANPYEDSSDEGTNVRVKKPISPTSYESESEESSDQSESSEKKSLWNRLGSSAFSSNASQSAPILRGQAADDDASAEEQKKNALGESPRKIQEDPSLADSWQSARRTYNNNREPSDDPNFPADEYIVDGGDGGQNVQALPNWEVKDLESEDTVAHFDTLDGDILVEPSNRVYIYSPRFGSVRQIVGPKMESQNYRLINMESDIAVAQDESRVAVDVRSQETGTEILKRKAQAVGVDSNQPGGSLSSEENVIENVGQTRLAKAENALKEAEISDENKPLVAEGAAAAAAWGDVQSVGVHIDRVAATGNVSLQAPTTIYQIENGTKTSKLELLKVASKREAAPGELIEFTIRFQNVGNELIGNVTIMDSLPPRLEYVDQTAKTSKKANFLVKNNETGSLILRWEITDPLEPGDFGVLTFLCKVR